MSQMLTTQRGAARLPIQCNSAAVRPTPRMLHTRKNAAAMKGPGLKRGANSREQPTAHRAAHSTERSPQQLRGAHSREQPTARRAAHSTERVPQQLRGAHSREQPTARRAAHSTERVPQQLRGAHSSCEDLVLRLELCSVLKQQANDFRVPVRCSDAQSRTPTPASHTHYASHASHKQTLNKPTYLEKCIRVSYTWLSMKNRNIRLL